MNYKEKAIEMGFFVNLFTDRQLEILQKALAQEAEDRATLYNEKLAEEYTDKLDDFADEIFEKGMTICYNGSPLDIRELSVKWRKN